MNLKGAIDCDVHPLTPVPADLKPYMDAYWQETLARLRGSLLVPLQNIELAVDEINRHADDQRFVQILLPVMGEQPLGKPHFWPVYAAAEKHGFAIAIHAGSSYHHPVTGSGWPTYYIEDYAAQAAGFHTQVGSLICEGVFVKYPKLKVVLSESGVSWLPAYLWRLSKFWRGIRNEVPWIDREPLAFVRDNIRLTLQPFDVPDDPTTVTRVMDQLGSDDLILFSTDFPHWHSTVTICCRKACQRPRFVRSSSTIRARPMAASQPELSREPAHDARRTRYARPGGHKQ